MPQQPVSFDPSEIDAPKPVQPSVVSFDPSEIDAPAKVTAPVQPRTGPQILTPEEAYTEHQQSLPPALKGSRLAGFVTPIPENKAPASIQQTLHPRLTKPSLYEALTDNPLPIEDIDRELGSFLVGPFDWAHRSAIRAALGMATPMNAVIAAGTAGLGAAAASGTAAVRSGARAVSGAVAAYFAGKAGQEMTARRPELLEAWKNGDYYNLFKLGGEDLIDAVFGASLGGTAIRHGKVAAGEAEYGVRQAKRAFGPGGKYGAGLPRNAEVEPDLSTLSEQDLIDRYKQNKGRGEVAQEILRRQSEGKAQAGIGPDAAPVVNISPEDIDVAPSAKPATQIRDAEFWDREPAPEAKAETPEPPAKVAPAEPETTSSPVEPLTPDTFMASQRPVAQRGADIIAGSKPEPIPQDIPSEQLTPEFFEGREIIKDQANAQPPRVAEQPESSAPAGGARPDAGAAAAEPASVPAPVEAPVEGGKPAVVPSDEPLNAQASKSDPYFRKAEKLDADASHGEAIGGNPKLVADLRAKAQAFRDEGNKVRGREAQAAAPAPSGRETSIAIPGEQTKYPARFNVRELADIQPSHNPFNFSANPAYPYTNDHDYSDTQGAARVVKQSTPGIFDPAFPLADSPTAEHGAPIVDARGAVLGGNSRTMTLARVYQAGGAEAQSYRNQLIQQAQQFGIDPARIAGMKAPVLVREVNGSIKKPQAAITDFNKKSAAELKPEERAVSDGRRLSPETIQDLAARVGDLGDSGTLAEALRGEDGAAVLNNLVKDGVLTDQEKVAYLNDRDELTPEIKSRIGKALVGRLYNTPAELRETAPEMRGKLERIAPHLLRVEGREGWNLTPQVRDAVGILDEARARGIKNLDDLAKQGAVNGDAAKHTPEAIAIARTLQGNPNAAVKAFRAYASDEALSREGAPSSFFEPPTRAEAFRDAFEAGVPVAQFSRFSPVPGFYSQLQRVIEQKIPAKTSPAQALAILKNPQHGVKADELKWSGVDEYLASHHGPVTRQELLDVAKQNAVEVHEITHGKHIDQNAVAVLKGQLAEVNSSLSDEIAKLRQREESSPYKEGSQVATVGAAPSRGGYSYSTGKTYQAERREDGLLVWKLSGTFGGTRSGRSGKFVAELKEQAAHPWMSNIADGSLVVPPSVEYKNLEYKRDKLDAELTRERRGEMRGAPTRYGKYTLPGQVDYHELLLTLPTPGRSYTSPHWNEPNVVAHIRMTDRTMPDGKRALLIEEIQSDWHQAGREHGYDHPLAEPLAAKLVDGLWEVSAADGELVAHVENWNRTEDQAVAEARRRLVENRSRTAQDKTVPVAPFSKTWQELAFRRALRWAAENGYDELAWTTGKQQAARYKLARHVSAISWQPSTGDLYIKRKGEAAYDAQPAVRDVTDANIADYIGKEAAARLLNAPPDEGNYRELSGSNLNVGGQGMSGFYDEILPSYARKVAKRWGSETHDIQIHAGIGKGKSVVHSLPITPAMRKSVIEEGQPLFARNTGAASIDQRPADATYHVELKDGPGVYRTDEGLDHHSKVAKFEEIPLSPRDAETAVAYTTNQSGVELLMRVLGTKPETSEHVGGLHLSAHDARTVADTFMGLGRIIHRPVNALPGYVALRNAVVKAADSGRSLVLAVDTPYRDMDQRAESLRHELNHSIQARITSRGNAQTHISPERDFFSNPLARRADQALMSMGYAFRTSGESSCEIGVRLMSNEWRKLGLTASEARDLAAHYIRTLRKEHGSEKPRQITRRVIETFRSVERDRASQHGAVPEGARREGRDGSPSGIEPNLSRYGKRNPDDSERDLFAPESVSEPELPGLREEVGKLSEDHAKLQGERLSAQFQAPVSREEQLKHLRRDKTQRQTSMFEQAPEEPQQGLFGNDTPAMQGNSAEIPKPNHIDPNESVQDRSIREWRENYARVQANPEAASATDLRRAIGYLDKARFGLIHRAQEAGRKVDPNVLAGFDNDESYFKILLKQRENAGERGSLPMLSDLADALKERFGPDDGPNANYSGLGAFKDKYIRNLSQLEGASPRAHQAAVLAASHRAQSAVLLRTAAPKIREALGADATPEEFRGALVESRLRGIRERWENFARQAARQTDMEALRAVENSGLLDLLGEIEGKRGLPQDMRQTAVALLKAQDGATLKGFLLQTFEEAAGAVHKFMDAGRFDKITATDGFKKALGVYKDSIEKPIAENHALNEGVFSNALGPLNTYYPLIAIQGTDFVGARWGRQVGYRKPENQANQFATGIAGGFDIGMDALKKRIDSAFRTNDRAALLTVLEEQGLLHPLHPGQGGQVFLRDGVEYKGERVEVEPSRIIIRDGKRTVTPARMAIVPQWLHRELKPILEKGDYTGGPGPLMNALNTFSLAGPADFLFHSSNLLGTLVANTPFLGDSPFWKAASIPYVKRFAALVKILATDPTTEQALAELREMSKLGLLPERYGSETFSRKVAEMIGGKFKRFSFGPALYGPKGIDVRARVVMYRIAKEANPDATPLELYLFVNQLGNYTRELQSTVERAIKATGWSPFYTAGSTMVRNGVNAWTGGGPTPKTGSASLRLWQQLTGGGLVAVALWMLAYKAYTGKQPWQDKRAKLFQIPVFDDIRRSALGAKLWGNGPQVGYINFGFFNPLASRGARALGIQAAADTAAAGGNARQMAEATATGPVNALLHPIMGPSARALFTGVSGSEAMVTGFRDRQGKPGVQMFPAVGPGDSFPHVLAGLKQLNSFAGNLGVATGLGPQEPFEKHGSQWFRMVTDLAVPQLFSQASNPYAKEKALANERRAVNNAAAKYRGRH